MADEPSGTGTEIEIPPDPKEELEREKAERLRLEGENRRLREEAAARPQDLPPQPISLDQMSLAQLEAALRETEEDGNITEAQRSRLLARLETQRMYRQREAKEHQDDNLSRSRKKLREAVAHHPELKDRASPLMQKVGAELDRLGEQFGLSPEDERTQALAVEHVLEGRMTVTDERDYDRLRRGGGVGGIGTGGGDDGRGGRGKPEPKSKGERIFSLLLPEHQQFYIDLRGSKEAAIKTLEHADEAQLRKAGRMA